MPDMSFPEENTAFRACRLFMRMKQKRKPLASFADPESGLEVLFAVWRSGRAGHHYKICESCEPDNG